MEEDRYEVNKSLYILGMVCLISSMSLVMFSLYILPHVFWNLHYDVPEFIMEWQVWFQEEQSWSLSAANWTIFGAFFVPGILLGWFSYLISNQLEQQLPKLHEEPVPLEVIRASQEGRYMFWKVFFIVLAILIVFGVVNFLISY
jgi:ABC-type multidrug transport system fused ATPase/permease subunit